MESSVKDYARDRWRAARSKKHAHARGRGGHRHVHQPGGASGAGEPAGVSKAPSDAELSDAEQQRQSEGADLAQLLLDNDPLYSQAHYRYRGYFEAPEEPPPFEALAEVEQGCQIDAARLDIILKLLPPTELFGLPDAYVSCLADTLPPTTTAAHAAAAAAANAPAASTAAATQQSAAGDAGAPVPLHTALGAFFLFCEEVAPQLQAPPATWAAAVQQLGQLWRDLPSDARQVYQVQAATHTAEVCILLAALAPQQLATLQDTLASLDASAVQPAGAGAGAAAPSVVGFAGAQVVSSGASSLAAGPPATAAGPSEAPASVQQGAAPAQLPQPLAAAPAAAAASANLQHMLPPALAAAAAGSTRGSAAPPPAAAAAAGSTPGSPAPPPAAAAAADERDEDSDGSLSELLAQCGVGTSNNGTTACQAGHIPAPAAAAASSVTAPPVAAPVAGFLPRAAPAYTAAVGTPAAQTAAVGTAVQPPGQRAGAAGAGLPLDDDLDLLLQSTAPQVGRTAAGSARSAARAAPPAAPGADKKKSLEDWLDSM